MNKRTCHGLGVLEIGRVTETTPEEELGDLHSRSFLLAGQHLAVSSPL